MISLLATSLSVDRTISNKDMPSVESHSYKTVGQRVEPFWFFQSSNSVEHMRIPKIVAFNVAFLKVYFVHQSGIQSLAQYLSSCRSFFNQLTFIQGRYFIISVSSHAFSIPLF